MAFRPQSGKTSMKRAMGGGDTGVYHSNKNGQATKFTRAIVMNKSTFRGKLKKGQRLA